MICFYVLCYWLCGGLENGSAMLIASVMFSQNFYAMIHHCFDLVLSFVFVWKFPIDKSPLPAKKNIKQTLLYKLRTTTSNTVFKSCSKMLTPLHLWLLYVVHIWVRNSLQEVVILPFTWIGHSCKINNSNCPLKFVGVHLACVSLHFVFVFLSFFLFGRRFSVLVWMIWPLSMHRRHWLHAFYLISFSFLWSTRLMTDK